MAANRFYKLNQRANPRRGYSPKFSWLAANPGCRMQRDVVTLYEKWFGWARYA